MREHPIPQDITNYRFHIVGSMTLKQFAEIGAGVALAIIIYNTNLFAIIKWPLILTSFGLGAMAAFVPIGERPLDHWIVTFFSVLYKPTQFFWKREARIPEVFSFTANMANTDTGPELDLSPARRERIKEFLVTLKTPLSVDASQIDLAEKQHIDAILSAFSVQSTAPVIARPEPKKPNLEVRVRNLGGSTQQREARQSTTPDKQFAPEDSVTYRSNKAQLSSDLVAQGIEIPEEQVINAGTDQVMKDADVINQHNLSGENRAFIQLNLQRELDLHQTSTAVVNRELPFPTKPTEPNKLVGMILTKNDELITDAIVEIQTPDGQIARAVKSNALGQFFVTTPLRKGEYVIVTEKDGFVFEPLQISLTNKVVEPLEIRGAELPVPVTPENG